MELYPERRRCVYALCEAQVTLLLIPAYPSLPAHRVAQRMQPAHGIVNANLDGPCPASNMYVGFTPWDPTPLETQRMLDERLPIDTRRAELLYHRKILDETIRKRKGGSTPGESQSLRNRRRLGREPVGPEDQKDWHLGGREDEESGHISPEPNQPVPSYVGGYSMTPGSQRMLLGEARGHLSAAMTQAGEAMGAAESGREQIAGAVASCQEATTNILAVGVDESDTLRTSYVQVVKAEADYRAVLEKLEEAGTALIQAQEGCQSVINAMSI